MSLQVSVDYQTVYSRTLINSFTFQVSNNHAEVLYAAQTKSYSIVFLLMFLLLPPSFLNVARIIVAAYNLNYFNVDALYCLK